MAKTMAVTGAEGAETSVPESLGEGKTGTNYSGIMHGPSTDFVTCPGCGQEQPDMGRGVACGLDTSTSTVHRFTGPDRRVAR